MSGDREPATVADIGELELLRRIRARFGSAPAGEIWSGDDAAVVRAPGGDLLLTTDMLVEGLDFDLAHAGGADIGWKALAANASDIAAMCGRPHHAVVALGLRLDTPEDLVEGLLDGLMEAAQRWRIGVVGGDLSGAGEISITVALTGSPVGAGVVTRAGAKAGDAICVTGSLGGAAAGLVALRRDLERTEPVRRLVARQLRPAARVDEAALLAECGLSAAIDVSDGLAVDLHRLCTESEVGCEVGESDIPIDPDIGVVGDLDFLELALLGGEDFELLFTVPEERVDETARRIGEVGTTVSRIGTVTSGPRRLGSQSLDHWKERGWQHLRGR